LYARWSDRYDYLIHGYGSDAAADQVAELRKSIGRLAEVCGISQEKTPAINDPNGWLDSATL
jgi:hypothetical protein